MSARRTVAITVATLVIAVIVGIIVHEREERFPEKATEPAARSEIERSSEAGNWTSFDDCAYYPARDHAASAPSRTPLPDSANPRPPRPVTSINNNAAMLDAHESLNVNDKRRLAENQPGPIGASSLPGYDVARDCRRPADGG